jgi:hypothetical protein
MDNRFQFQTTYVQPDGTDSDPGEPLYASDDGRVAPLSAEECLFIAKTSGEPHVMTLQVLRALDLCREFRRLDEHTARIEAEISDLSGKRDDIRRVLAGLIQRKLLASADDFLARLRNIPARNLAPMRAVFIRACDRPDRLGHLLASLADYERRHRAARRYVLIDDSRLASHSDDQRDQLREFARKTGCDVRYIGRVEVQKLIEGFAKIHPQSRNAAQHVLLRDAQSHAHRFGGGRSRNLALILSAGSRLALLDDDLRLPLRRPDFAEDGFDPDPDAPMCTRFFAGMDEALSSGTDVEQDPFDLHLHACGQALATFLDDRHALRRSALHGLNLGRLDALKQDARIISTHHGSYGSSRSESTLWLYRALDPAGREEFWSNRENYLRNTQAHYILYGARRARIRDVPGFTPFTLDNTSLLPCTNPVGRAEDSLAAALTHYCIPDSVSLELPVAIGHVQESLRGRFSHMQGASVPRVNDFLRDFVTQQFGLYKSADTGQRLVFLAHVMRDLARAPLKERVEHLHEYRRFVHAEIVNGLQHQLEATAAAPVFWQADVRAIVQANAKGMLGRSAPRLAEWPQDIDAAGCAQALTDELDAIADAIEHWPTLWLYAAEQGDRLLSAL